MTRAANYLRALDQRSAAVECGCGMIYLCQADDEAAADVQAATAIEKVGGMLCARIGPGNAIWPLPQTFGSIGQAKWEAAKIRAAAAALVDDPTDPVAVALRALAKVLMDEIQQIKAGKPKASKTWAEHCAALRAAISGGLGDA